MRVIRDTKGTILYKVENNVIISHGPSDMKTIHKTIREGKTHVNRSNRS